MSPTHPGRIPTYDKRKMAVSKLVVDENLEVGTFGGHPLYPNQPGIHGYFLRSVTPLPTIVVARARPCGRVNLAGIAAAPPAGSDLT
jgi:hypothetical protein